MGMTAKECGSAAFYAFCADMMAGIEASGRCFFTASAQKRTMQTLYCAGFRSYKEVIDAGVLCIASIPEPPTTKSLAVIFGEEAVLPFDKGAFKCSRCGKPTNKDGSFGFETWSKFRDEHGRLETKRTGREFLCKPCGKKVRKAINDAMTVEEASE